MPEIYYGLSGPNARKKKVKWMHIIEETDPARVILTLDFEDGNARTIVLKGGD